MTQKQATVSLRNIEKVLSELATPADEMPTFYFVNCPPEKQERFVGIAERLQREGRLPGNSSSEGKR